MREGQQSFPGMPKPAKVSAYRRPALKPIEPLGTAPGQERLILSPAYEEFKRVRERLWPKEV